MWAKKQGFYPNVHAFGTYVPSFVFPKMLRHERSLLYKCFAGKVKRSRTPRFGVSNLLFRLNSQNDVIFSFFLKKFATFTQQLTFGLRVRS